MLDFTEGDVLLRTDTSLGGAGEEVVLHAVTFEDRHAAGVAFDGERHGEATARIFGAVANRRGEANRVGGFVELPARHLEDVGIVNRGDNSFGHLSFRVWGFGAGRDSTASKGHRASFLGGQTLGGVGGFNNWLSVIQNFQWCPYFRGEIP